MQLLQILSWYTKISHVIEAGYIKYEKNNLNNNLNQKVPLSDMRFVVSH